MRTACSRSETSRSGSTAGETDAGVGPIGYHSVEPHRRDVGGYRDQSPRAPGNPQVRGHDLSTTCRRAASRATVRGGHVVHARRAHARSRKLSLRDLSLLDVRTTGGEWVSRSGSTSRSSEVLTSHGTEPRWNDSGAGDPRHRTGSALVTLWELASLTPVGEPLRPSHPVSSLAFSPDSANLAVGSEDASVTSGTPPRSNPSQSRWRVTRSGDRSGLRPRRRYARLGEHGRSLSSGTYRRRGRTLRPSLCPSPSSRISPSAPTARSSQRQPACPPESPDPDARADFGDSALGRGFGRAPSERRSRAAPRSRSSHSAMTAECSRARPRTTRSSCGPCVGAHGGPAATRGGHVYQGTSTSAPTVRFWRRPDVEPEAGEEVTGRTPSHFGDPEVRLWTLDSSSPAGEPFAEGRRTRRL